MRVLMFGASGFLGGHILTRLVASDLDVVVAGRTAPADGHQHVQIDLAMADHATLAELVGEVRPAVVVNATGSTGFDPVELARVNVTAVAATVRTLLRAAPAARLVHLGSAAEYGVTPDGSSTSEEAPARPVGAYGLSKLAATEAIRTAREVGLDATVLRVTNPVGPGAPTSTVAGSVAATLRRTGPDDPVELGPGDAWRDFVDVRDVAEAVWAAAVSTERPPGILNVGSGKACRVQEVMDVLRERSGHRGPVTVGGDGSRRSAAVPWQQADIALARRVLDWSPTYDLDASLSDLWRALG